MNTSFASSLDPISILMALLFRKFYIYKLVKLEVKDFASDGMILDIGGGGEGVISRLKGKQVVAIDLHKDELDGIPDGSQKIVMDARALDFADDSFATATAFFSMMYMKTREDQQRAVQEVWRVLKPNGRLLVWDINLATRPKTRRAAYLLRLRYCVGSYEKETAYGASWPGESRGESYYLRIASEAGFQHLVTERIDHCFHFGFYKPG